MDKLHNIINDCINKHTGGEEFFNALDAQLQDEDIINRLHLLIYSTIHIRDYGGIIVSGKFGRYYSELQTLSGDSPQPIIISINGGLRSSEVTLDFSNHKEFSINISKKWIFLDDSFYSGTTRDKINKALNDIGHKLVHTFAVYDGSVHKDDKLSSLYKYYSK